MNEKCPGVRSQKPEGYAITPYMILYSIKIILDTEF
jgi:hypothetical protein